MIAAGYEAKPAILQRIFNEHYTGNPVTLHGVRILVTLAVWLKVEPQVLRWGKTTEQIRETKRPWEQAVAARERETFEAFLTLTGEHKKIVREIIKALAQLKSEFSWPLSKQLATVSSR
jgi:hypothetical protein